MNNLIQIDKNEINALKLEGKKIVLEPKAEKALLKLLTLQKLVNDAVDEVKENIQIEANKIMPNFKGIVAENVKIMHRTYGGKYSFKKEEINVIDKSFLKEQVRYTIDSKEVDRYIKENEELPSGINEAFRSPKLSIIPKDGVLDEETKKLLN